MEASSWRSFSEISTSQCPETNANREKWRLWLCASEYFGYWLSSLEFASCVRQWSPAAFLFVFWNKLIYIVNFSRRSCSLVLIRKSRNYVCEAARAFCRDVYVSADQADTCTTEKNISRQCYYTYKGDRALSHNNVERISCTTHSVFWRRPL